MLFLSIDFIFFIDMVFTFFTSFTDMEKLEEVYDKKSIAIRYLSCWFWIDLISIFPFGIIGKALKHNESLQVPNSKNGSDEKVYEL